MRKVIAIDFDGCLCRDRYPAVGPPNWEVIRRARAEQDSGADPIRQRICWGKFSLTGACRPYDPRERR